MNALALVIGNSNYQGDVLPNAGNDAVDIGNVLKRLGFFVDVQLDATGKDFDEAITHFGTELDNFDIGLFYFAGHGFQVDGNNYLAPVDVKTADESGAKHSSIKLGEIVDRMYKATNPTNIIILDACRDNPFEKSWKRGLASAGLAPQYAPKGTIICYATSPGETASDGAGKNGLYTSALLKHIETEGIEIEECFKRVRQSVHAFSKGQQTSWEHTSLIGGFQFNSGQLVHSVGLPYTTKALADKDYQISSDPIDSIIERLKSHDWYVQNPAIEEIGGLDPAECSKDQLMVLGRNLLQAACGDSAKAVKFVDKLKDNLAQFDDNGVNHVLNGILYEIYFDASGLFRGENIKGHFLNEVLKLQGESEFEESFKFIKEELKPFVGELLYVPDVQEHTVSINLVLNREMIDGTEEVVLEQVVYESKNLLSTNEAERLWIEADRAYYKSFTMDALTQRLATELNAPSRYLSIQTNFEVEDDTIIKYPYGYKASVL